MEENEEFKAVDISGDIPEINIYDLGHFEGLVFVLNEPIPGPDGKGTIEKIDLSHAFPDAVEAPGGIEFIIAGFLQNYQDSEPVTEEEAQQLRGHLYN